MNKWECTHPDCDVTAVGAGGAIGLRAIGWWFEPGPLLFCPAHRPDPVPCHQKDNRDHEGTPCRMCRAEDEASRHQKIIQAVLKSEPDGCAFTVWEVRADIPYETGYNFGTYTTETLAEERAAMPDLQNYRNAGEIIVDCIGVWDKMPPGEKR